MFLAMSNFAQNKSCEDLHNGKFIYADNDRSEVITRIGDVQISINKITGVEIHSSIEWISDCEYIQTFEKVLNHPKDVSRAIGTKVNYEIIDIDGNEILVRATNKQISYEREIRFKKIGEVNNSFIK